MLRSLLRLLEVLCQKSWNVSTKNSQIHVLLLPCWFKI